jgi:hypothetical protein
MTSGPLPDTIMTAILLRVLLLVLLELVLRGICTARRIIMTSLSVTMPLRPLHLVSPILGGLGPHRVNGTTDRRTAEDMAVLIVNGTVANAMDTPIVVGADPGRHLTVNS